MAAKHGDLPTVRILLESGQCDVSLTDQDVRFLLHTYIIHMYMTTSPVSCIMLHTSVQSVVSYIRDYNIAPSNIWPGIIHFRYYPRGCGYGMAWVQVYYLAAKD